MSQRGDEGVNGTNNADSNSKLNGPNDLEIQINNNSQNVSGDHDHEEKINEDEEKKDELQHQRSSLTKLTESDIMTTSNFTEVKNKSFSNKVRKRRLSLVDHVKQTDAKKVKAQCCKAVQTHWLYRYPKAFKKNIFKDLVTGITLGVILIPQGLSYGLLAGLPAYYGLYSCLIAPPVYAIFCSSNELSIGPFALISLLVLNTISSAVPPTIEGTNGSVLNSRITQSLDSGSNADIINPDYIDAVFVVTFLVGIFLMILSALQLGLIVNFLANPVLTSVTTAGSFLIATSQMTHLFGVSYPESDNFFISWKYIFTTLDEVNITTFIIGVVSILLMILIDWVNDILKERYKFKGSIPASLVVLVLDILIVYFFNLDEVKNVRILGNIPSGLPAFSAPRFAKFSNVFGTLIISSLVIAIVGFSLSVATAKTLAEKRKYEINPNQELFSHGVANLAGCFFLNYPCFGSLSRSAIAYSYDVDTPLHNIFSAVLVCLVLLFLTKPLEPLPYSALSAIILYSLRSLFKQVLDLPKLFKQDISDFLIWIGTFFAVLWLGIAIGLGIGVLISFVLLLRTISYPPYAVLGVLETYPVTDDGDFSKKKIYFKNVKRFKEVKEIDGLVIFRFDSSLHFANQTFFRDQLRKATSIRIKNIPNDRPRVLILECSAISRIDSTAISTLIKVITEMKNKQMEVFIAGAKWRLREALDKQKTPAIKHVIRFLTLEDAFKAAIKLLQGNKKAVKKSNETNVAVV